MRDLVERGGRRLVLDLAGVSYVDNIGVSELVRSHVIVDTHGGHLALAAMPAQVDQLLRVTRLDQVFDRFSTLARAAEHVGQTDV